MHCRRQDFNQCVVCFDDLNPEEKCIAFPGCNHNYHFQCLNLWFQKSKTMCPVCKTEFRDEFADAIIQKMQTGFIKVTEPEKTEAQRKSAREEQNQPKRPSQEKSKKSLEQETQVLRVPEEIELVQTSNIAPLV